jgi:uncharacterized protein YjiS (DUF1127 family)
MIALSRLSLPTAPRAGRAVPRPRGLLATLGLWAERHRERRALLELNDHMLKDIGISGADAWQEGSKPFWRS